jgi:hypothetical protein
MADDALVEQGLDRAELLAARHAGVDAVQLPQVDPLDAELVQALARLGDQVVQPALRRPMIRAGAKQPDLVATARPELGCSASRSGYSDTSGP